jgi:hypothetical protein
MTAWLFRAPITDSGDRSVLVFVGFSGDGVHAHDGDAHGLLALPLPL